MFDDNNGSLNSVEQPMVDVNHKATGLDKVNENGKVHSDDSFEDYDGNEKEFDEYPIRRRIRTPLTERLVTVASLTDLIV
jgi:hypothetical protein